MSDSDRRAGLRRSKLQLDMPNRPCPRCQRTGRFLKDSSAIALVDYYRCDFCNEVWCLDKSDPDKPHRIVTVPRKPEQTER